MQKLWASKVEFRIFNLFFTFKLFFFFFKNDVSLATLHNYGQLLSLYMNVSTNTVQSVLNSMEYWNSNGKIKSQDGSKTILSASLLI